MYPPFSTLPLPLEAVDSDPPARLVCLESLSLFHILFLAPESKPESWTRNVLLLGSPWADGHGALVVCSRASCKRPGAQGQAGEIGLGIGMHTAGTVACGRCLLPHMSRLLMSHHDL
jgi:hypothetical protein